MCGLCNTFTLCASHTFRCCVRAVMCTRDGSGNRKWDVYMYSRQLGSMVYTAAWDVWANSCSKILRQVEQFE